eukprot:COSAG02_NODE_16278_length_1096_cov_10.225677_1_plen_120_part_00
MLTSYGCTAVLMCCLGASGNGIGDVASERVASALRVCAAASREASREAPLAAALSRLALAAGLVPRLSEHSVLGDCPLDCISTCGTYCSTQLAMRALVAQSTPRNGAAGYDSPVHCSVQ